MFGVSPAAESEAVSVVGHDRLVDGAFLLYCPEAPLKIVVAHMDGGVLVGLSVPSVVPSEDHVDVDHA